MSVVAQKLRGICTLYLDSVSQNVSLSNLDNCGLYRWYSMYANGPVAKYFPLSHCFQSLRLVCSSSHELLIRGISVRIFLMQWFPIAFCMIVFRHTVGLLWTSDQPVSETSTCTGQHNIETQEANIHALSEIRIRDPSNQVAADLRLRPRGYRGRQYFPTK
jgi:hypothetical protein